MMKVSPPHRFWLRRPAHHHLSPRSSIAVNLGDTRRRGWCYRHSVAYGLPRSFVYGGDHLLPLPPHRLPVATSRRQGVECSLPYQQQSIGPKALFLDLQLCEEVRGKNSTDNRGEDLLAGRIGEACVIQVDMSLVQKSNHLRGVHSQQDGSKH